MAKINRKEIEEKVKEILSKELGIKPENITPEKRLVEDLGMDSFNAIEIAFELEEIFGIKISQEDIPKIQTVKDIIERVRGSK